MPKKELLLFSSKEMKNSSLIALAPRLKFHTERQKLTYSFHSKDFSLIVVFLGHKKGSNFYFFYFAVVVDKCLFYLLLVRVKCTLKTEAKRENFLNDRNIVTNFHHKNLFSQK